MMYDGLKSDDRIEFGFQKNIDLDKFQYLFKYDYSDEDPTKKLTLASNDKDSILQYIQDADRKHFYELIPHGVAVREYYDIDFVIDRDWTDEKKLEWTEGVVSTLLDVRNNLYNDTIHNKDLIVLESHSTVKLSIHIISRTTGFPCNSIQRLQAMDVFKELHQRNVGWNIDNSVYTKNRCFRMLHQSKRGKDVKLKVYNPTKYNYTTLFDSLVRIYGRRPGSADGRRPGSADEETPKVRFTSKYNHSDVTVDRMRYSFDKNVTDMQCDDVVSSFLKAHPEYTIRICKDGMIRLDRIQKSKCLTGVKVHETQDAMIYSSLNRFYFRCFCAEGKSICIGKSTTKTFEPIEVSKLLTHRIDGYIDEKQYDEIIADVHTVFDMRYMGNGKTHNAIHWAMTHRLLASLDQQATSLGKKVVFISHRQSLDEDIAYTYGASSYRDSSFQMGEFQSIVINSLDSKLEDLDQYYCFVFDEIQSLIKQLEMRDISAETIHLFMDVIERFSGKLIMLDANLTDQTIEYISRLRQRFPKRAVIGNLNMTPQFKMSIINIDGAQNIWKSRHVDMIIENDYSEHKIIVPTNLGIYTRTQAIIELIKSHRPELTILEINKDTRGNIDLQNSEWLAQFDILIISPTISEGVSFASDVFQNHKVIGMFTNQSSGPDTCLQMMRRFRKAKEYHVTIACDFYRARFQNESQYYEYASSHMNEINRNCSRARVWNEDEQRKKLCIVKDDFWDLHSRNVIEEELGKAQFLKAFVQMARRNLFDVSVSSLERNDYVYIDKEGWDQLTGIVSKNLESDVKNAPLISRDEYLELKKNKKSKCSKEATMKMKKFKIHEALNCHTPESSENINYEYWLQPRNRERLFRLKLMFEFTRDTTMNLIQLSTRDVLQRKLESHYTALEMIDEFPKQRTMIQSAPAMVSYVFENILRPLGFDNVPCWNNPSLRQFRENLNSLRLNFSYEKYIELNRVRWKACKGRLYYDELVSSNRAFPRFIDSVISDLGLGLKKTGKNVMLVSGLTKLTLNENDKPSLTDLFLNEEMIRKYDDFFQNDKGDKEEELNTCLKCGKEFKRTDNLNRHQETCGVEKEKKEYKCDICSDKTFRNSKSHWKRHMKGVHKLEV